MRTKKFPRNQKLVDIYIQKSGGYFELADMGKKLVSEAKELRRAITRKSKKSIDDEVGDVVFTINAISNKAKVNSDIALRNSIRKFIQRGDPKKLKRRGTNS